MLNILILQLRRITDSPFELITAQHPSRECANIKRFLDSNYGENISLDHLSAISHLNKYYLSHEFTKYYGISPMNYLNRKRIEVCKSFWKILITGFQILRISQDSPLRVISPRAFANSVA